jgi:gas vesicle protein
MANNCGGDCNKNKSGFGFGMIFGVLAGAVAGLLLSPKTGKQNRELIMKKAKELEKKLEDQHLDKKMKEFVGDTTEETKEVYEKVKSEVIKDLSELKDKIDDIDKEKYVETVKDVIERTKEDHEIPKAKLEKIKKMLEKDWSKLQTKPKSNSK